MIENLQYLSNVDITKLVILGLFIIIGIGISIFGQVKSKLVYELIGWIYLIIFPLSILIILLGCRGNYCQHIIVLSPYPGALLAVFAFMFLLYPVYIILYIYSLLRIRSIVVKLIKF